MGSQLTSADAEAVWGIATTGFHWEWVPALSWQTLPPGDPRGCRWNAGPGHRQCGKAPVAVLLRGTSRRPWVYCAEHLYGRRIVDGVVFGPVLRADS